MIFFDTETIGFHGPIVIIQWAEDDGPIQIHNVWERPVYETLILIKKLCDNNVCAFNLAFDWFHISQTFNTLWLFENKSALPIDCLEEYIECEEKGRDGLCLKPKGALDLMLYARKGPFQSLMERRPIIIKKIPNELAYRLSEELNERIKIDNIYFGRRAKKLVNPWLVEPMKDDNKEIIYPDYKNIVMRFAPDGGLKSIASFILGGKYSKFDDIQAPPHPLELGYAPYAKAIMSLKRWPIKAHAGKFRGRYKGAWPTHLHAHVAHWEYNPLAREYATDDVDLLRKLYVKFDKPPINDTDSILAAMVGTVRWKGFAVDIPALEKLTADRLATYVEVPTGGNECKHFLYSVMDDIEALGCGGSTSKEVLTEILEWVDHPAAVRARLIMDAREVIDETRLYNKLILAGRFHASFSVIGARSSRMSGKDQLNAMGVKKKKEVRRAFTYAFPGEVFSGGDFSNFEVGIFEAASGDPRLKADLESGLKIHGIFGQDLFPGKTYDEIRATEGLGGDADLYTRSKRGVFAKFFGGEAYTLSVKVGVSMEVAEKADRAFDNRYPTAKENRDKFLEQFKALVQEEGLGTKIIWQQPNMFVSSLLGFKRYFTLEYKIMQAIFELAQELPKEWKDYTEIIQRTSDRNQTVYGAVQSALYGAAFNIQSQVVRAANNHRIQSTGAGITKEVQAEVWSLQPTGIKQWKVRCMQVHDEILVVSQEELLVAIEEIVLARVTELQELVPLMGIEWATGSNWAEL